ncbi:hypothetical protein ACHAAC_08065 [Aeromicrobium sp. CF4.19]|uniref:hypothetical protein n=1 Tax=Aeromicrobium sp. CF4.19 TaxID=3373082 RepID=UPI003EE63A24
MDRDPQPRRLGRATSRLAAAAVLLLSFGVLQSSAETGIPEHPNFPGQGLPDHRAAGVGGQYVAPQVRGNNYVSAAKQWVSVPTIPTAAYLRNTRETAEQFDPTCLRLDGQSNRKSWQANVVLLNSAADPEAPNRFGATRDFDVRTVAFGAIPVEATIALEQPRDSAGVVVPADFEITSGEYCPGYGPFPTRPPGGPTGNTFANAATIDGEVRTSVRSLHIDGVPVEVSDSCGAEGAQLEVTSTPYIRWDPSITPEEQPTRPNFTTTPYYNPAVGGRLFGTVDIPAFSGCLTATGDDLSPLLTSAVSGPGNPLEMRSEGLEGSENFVQCPWSGNCPERIPDIPVPTTPPATED